MNIYIWDDVARLTDRYHSWGGCVVIAATEARARQLVKEKEPESDLTEPVTLSLPVPYTEEVVFIFPDAGCC